MTKSDNAPVLLDIDNFRGAVDLAFDSNSSEHDLYFFQVLTKNKPFREYLTRQDVDLEALDNALNTEIKLLKRNTLAAQQKKAQKDVDMRAERISGSGEPQINFPDLWAPPPPEDGPEMLDTLEIIAAAKTKEYGGKHLPIAEVIAQIFTAKPGMQLPKSYDILGVKDIIAASIGQNHEADPGVAHAVARTQNWVEQVQRANSLPGNALDGQVSQDGMPAGPSNSTATEGRTFRYHITSQPPSRG